MLRATVKFGQRHGTYVRFWFDHSYPAGDVNN